MKNLKLRVLVFVAACTLSMASLAAVQVPCKSGQKAVQNGKPVCASVKATPKAKTVSKAKSATKTRVVTKSHSKGNGKNTGKSASRIRTTAATSLPAAPELPASAVNVDCDSTQTLLQGGAAQCPAVPGRPGLPAQAQSNPGTACFAALAASHSARRLASKVPFLTDSAAGPEALADRGVPNKMEKEELGSVMAGYGMCLDMAASWRAQNYEPAVVSALDAFWRSAQSILGELAGGKRTFGDAARAIVESDKAYRAQIGNL